MAEKKPQVFLSYAHEDLPEVQRLYDDLTACGVNVWFDKVNLKPGTRWKRAIEKAIPKSRFFLICLSQSALRKLDDEPGFQDEELQQAYEIAREQEEQHFAIIPIRLEECGRGDTRLSGWQQVDLFPEWTSEVNDLAVWLGGDRTEEMSDREPLNEQSQEQQLITGLLGKVFAFYYAGDYERLLTTAEAVIALDAESADAWLNKGVALGEFGRYEEALMAFNQTILLNPQSPKAWNNKGAVLHRMNQYEEALRSYERAITLQPGYSKALNNKQILLRAMSMDSLQAYGSPAMFLHMNAGSVKIERSDESAEVSEGKEKNQKS